MYLLDTHIFLWARDEVGRLTEKECAIIEDPAQEVYVSAASIWEIAIKYRLNKLKLAAPERLIAGCPFAFLSIKPEDGWLAAMLPPHHHDPFDRMLVAQAQAYGCTLITRDAAIARYGIPILAA